MTKKIKLSDLAKDLNVPSQELIEALTALDETQKKTGSGLTEQEVNYLLERYTQGNQVESFEAYFQSRNEKPAEKPAPRQEEKPKRAAKSEPKKPAKPEAKSEKPVQKPVEKQEPKTGQKPAPKPEAKGKAKPAPKPEKAAQKQKSVPDEARYAAEAPEGAEAPEVPAPAGSEDRLHVQRIRYREKAADGGYPGQLCGA